MLELAHLLFAFTGAFIALAALIVALKTPRLGQSRGVAEARWSCDHRAAHDYSYGRISGAECRGVPRRR